jgi:predicted homoserine dehydrogenase-like protein
MRKITIVLAFIFTLALYSTPSFAQDSGAAGASASSSKTVTGCLKAGKRVGGFILTTDDGTAYMLHIKSVTLADHVGHTVTVTGKEAQRQSNSGANGSQSDDSTTGHGNMNKRLIVSDLSMVKDTCSAAK